MTNILCPNPQDHRKNIIVRHRVSDYQNKGVAPVLATLLMVAVAVAMSVIIFMWSQSFLAGTSESTGSQQGSQNQAAQSSIAIETVTGTASVSDPSITILSRNVGAISVNIGSVTVSGLSSNTGFTGSLIATAANNTGLDIISSDNSVWTTSANNLETVAKGGGIIINLAGSGSPTTTFISSGDVITVKITTDKGTFAQSSYTVP